MIKILLTGDNHFGKKYNSIDDENAREKIINARMEALTNAIKIGNKEKCDLLVVAGDLFENLSVLTKIQKDIVKVFSDFSGEAILILPGNHDYYNKENNKFWNKFKDLASVHSDRVILFTENKPFNRTINDNNITIYPCICNSKHSLENALGWIKDVDIDDKNINIGIAHGAIEGLSLDADSKYYKMTREELENYKMDAWLIGHTHIPEPKQIETKGCRIYNAGTHQQTDISNNSKGTVFVIEIDDNKNIKSKMFVTGVMEFKEISVKLNQSEDLEEKLIDSLKNLAKNKTDLRLKISGTCNFDDFENRGNIYDRVLKEFLYCEKLDDSKLKKEITKELIDKETFKGTVENDLLNSFSDNMELLNIAYDLIKECKEKE